VKIKNLKKLMKEVVQCLRLIPPQQRNPNVPLLVYLPGMDGTGELFAHQLGYLGNVMDVYCLTIPGDDLNDWDALAGQVVALVEAEMSESSPRLVYLLGESFGGCLAIKTILHSPHLFDRLILSNPASAFKRQPLLFWGSYLVQPQLDAVHQWFCNNFVPFLATTDRIEPRDHQLLIQAMHSVTQKASIWRLAMLRAFNVSDQEFRSIIQPTLLIASGRDRLLPSFSEAERLARLLPHAKVQVLPQSGHACLLETQVDLLEIMRANEFLDPAEIGARDVERIG
jgi:pimeloyl-ACP methyl ester carboxylesterase